MSGIGEWTMQLEDSWKHSQQHCSSNRSTDERSRVVREGKCAATRESRVVSTRGRKVSFNIVRPADSPLKMSKQRVLCVESPSEEKSSSSDRRDANLDKIFKEDWTQAVGTLSCLCICAHAAIFFDEYN